MDNSDCTGLWVSEHTLYRNVAVGASGFQQMQLQSFSLHEGKNIIAQDRRCEFHDVLVFQEKVYLVSTGTNEVVVFALNGTEIKRYRFPGQNDSWHINCLGVWDERIVLSAFGEFDQYLGYKSDSRKKGFVMDLETGAKLWDGLSQPHTPIQHNSQYFVCNSQERQLLIKSKSMTSNDNTAFECLQFDAFTRGLAFGEDFIYLGLSESRNIEAHPSGTPGARVVALDIKTRQVCGEVKLPLAEIYDLKILSKADRHLPTLMLSTEVLEMRRSISVAEGKFQRSVNAHIVMRAFRWLQRKLAVRP